jgi:RNA polymerase sigma factor (sigma-70 family)
MDDGRVVTTVEAPGGPGGSELDGALGFEAFFLAHHVALYRAMWLVTRNRHEAEEVMQDAFVRVWSKWPKVASTPDPAGYLYRTAMNVFRSRVRRAKVAVRKATRMLPPDDLLAAVEERDAVVRALAPLTPRQRAAVVLTDVLGMTSDEAALALGVRPPTVRVLAARGRKALREAMGDAR